jgi:hypothetical protein
MTHKLVSVVLVLVLFSPAGGLVGQTAPQRSDELCLALKQSADDAGKQFSVTTPGACRMRLDNAYTLFVDYSPQVLHVGMTLDPVVLNGDASAFWLRLSALDNLVETALYTKQRAVFDEFNRLVAKDLAPYVMKHKEAPNKLLRSRTEKVALGVLMDPGTAIISLIASADVSDIEKAQRARKNAADAEELKKGELARKRAADAARTARVQEERPQAQSGGVAAWRRILGGALGAFAEAAKSSANTPLPAEDLSQSAPLLSQISSQPETRY